MYPSIQNLLLAATALGLGSSLTTLALLFGRELASIVGLPDEVVPMAVVPLGWPAAPAVSSTTHPRLREVTPGVLRHRLVRSPRA